MAERADPVPAAPAGWSLLPVLRRMATMPLRDPFAFTGLLIYILFVLVALSADQLAPLDPMEILFTKAGKLAANLGPSADFPLGTTNLGRDIYAQLVHGTRSALAVGLSAAIIVSTVGTAVGLMAGYFGGATDSLLMRIADMALSLPFLPFVIVLTGFLGASTSNIVLAVALLLWPNSARVIRSQVLTLRERAYVEAARQMTGSMYLARRLPPPSSGEVPSSYEGGGVMVIAGSAPLQWRSSLLLRHEDARLESRAPSHDPSVGVGRRHLPIRMGRNM